MQAIMMIYTNEKLESQTAEPLYDMLYFGGYFIELKSILYI